MKAGERSNEYTWQDWFNHVLAKLSPDRQELARLQLRTHLKSGGSLPIITEAQIKALKRSAADSRYNKSVKGRIRRERFLGSEKGKASDRASKTKYNQSQKGKNRAARYYNNNRDECNNRTSLSRL